VANLGVRVGVANFFDQSIGINKSNTFLSGKLLLDQSIGIDGGVANFLELESIDRY